MNPYYLWSLFDPIMNLLLLKDPLRPIKWFCACATVWQLYANIISVVLFLMVLFCCDASLLFLFAHPDDNTAISFIISLLVLSLVRKITIYINKTIDEKMSLSNNKRLLSSIIIIKKYDEKKSFIIFYH